MENIKMNRYQRLQQMEFLMGIDETVDQFEDEYESFITEIKKTGDSNYLRPASELLHRQLKFLTRRWIELYVEEAASN